MIVDATLLLVCTQTMLFASVAGVLGVFVFLRSQSLVGDTISHASLPGIMGVFLLTSSTHPLLLLCGGALSGLFGIQFISYVSQSTKIKYDAILGIVLSVFFGFGIVLMTVAQKVAGEQQAVINKFLFGSASTILYSDLWVMVVIASVVFLIIGLSFKEFTLFVFDPLLAQSVGYPIKKIDLLLNMLLIATIVVGLQTVGVILMSTMLVAPAAAARQWTHRIRPMLILAVFIAITCSLCGVLISGSVDQMPTGPTIAVLLSSFVFFSVFYATNVQELFMRIAQ